MVAVEIVSIATIFFCRLQLNVVYNPQKRPYKHIIFFKKCRIITTKCIILLTDLTALAVNPAQNRIEKVRENCVCFFGM
jgi:hypothetical protein